MLSISHMKVLDYRSLARIEVALKDLSVIVGANGCGKSTFIDVFRLLKAATEGRLEEAVRLRGGISSMSCKLWAPLHGVWFAAAIRSGDGDEGACVVYEIGLAPQGASYYLTIDTVTIASDMSDPFRSGQVVIARVSGDDQQELRVPGQPKTVVKGPPPTESVISGPLQHEQGRLIGFLLRGLFSEFVFLRPIPVDERAPVRLPQDITVGTVPSDDGDRLFASLYNMRLESPEVFETLLDKIRLVYPSFRKLDFPVAASGKISLYWYDAYNKEPLDQRELSDGTLRFLWLLTILHSPNKPPLILIDEPEVSMHPQMLMVLADAMKEASAQTQLIVATHSDRLLRWMDPEDVCVMDMEDGQTRMSWLDPERLKSWLERYTLDELWQMGELGGRP